MINWIAALDDMDLVVVLLNGNLPMVIYRVEMDFYEHNPRNSFRQITDEEKADYERSIQRYGESIKRDRDAGWALT